jgi:hypothetical protein
MHYKLGQMAALTKLGLSKADFRYMSVPGYAKSMGAGAVAGGTGGYLAGDDDSKLQSSLIGGAVGGVLGGVGKHYINKSVGSKAYKDLDPIYADMETYLEKAHEASKYNDNAYAEAADAAEPLSEKYDQIYNDMEKRLARLF